VQSRRQVSNPCCWCDDGGVHGRVQLQVPAKRSFSLHEAGQPSAVVEGVWKRIHRCLGFLVHQQRLHLRLFDRGDDPGYDHGEDRQAQTWP